MDSYGQNQDQLPRDSQAGGSGELFFLTQEMSFGNLPRDMDTIMDGPRGPSPSRLKNARHAGDIAQLVFFHLAVHKASLWCNTEQSQDLKLGILVPGSVPPDHHALPSLNMEPQGLWHKDEWLG